MKNAVSLENRNLSVEDIWRERLKSAKNEYGLAVGQCYDALERPAELPAPGPTDQIGIRMVLSRESAALNEYMRVLQVFSDVTAVEKKRRVCSRIQ